MDILKNHMKVHTKETPYACPNPLCGKRFSNRAALTYHLQRQGCQQVISPKAEFCEVDRFSKSNNLSEEIYNESTSEGTYDCEGSECFAIHAKKEALETQSYPMVENHNWVLKDAPKYMIPVEEKTMSVDLLKIMQENELLKQRLEENFKRISLLTTQFNFNTEEKHNDFDCNHFFQEADCSYGDFDYKFNFDQ